MPVPVVVRHARAALLAAALAPLLASSGAFAGTADVPDPRFSSYSPCLLGTSSGEPIEQTGSRDLPRADGFVIEARDVNNAPKIGRPAQLIFTDTNLKFYVDQESGTTVDCAQRILSRLTDSHGIATFHPRFGGFTNPPQVWAATSGVYFGQVPARSTDMDGQGGETGLSDLTTFLPYYFARSTSHPEADFDGSGGPVDLADLSIMVREYQSGARSSTCP